MKEQGFGLVWIAILLLLVGGIASTVMMRQENNAVWEPKTSAQENLTAVAEALAAYQRANHKLPCAAPLSAKPSDAGYAISVTDCNVASSGNTVAAGYHIGALPSRTLGLPDRASEDKWGNKLTYAVTIALTNPFSFTTGSGNMTVLGKTPRADAAYVVITHGPDGKGAFTSKAGLLAKTCASVVGADQENCDNDATFLDANSENTAGTSFYDDQILAAAVDTTAQQQNKPCSIATSGNAVWDGGQCINSAWDTAPTGLLHGESRSIGETNSADADGTVTITCNNAVLDYSGGACVAHCNANPVQSWGTPANCQGTPPNTNHGAVSASTANTAPGFSGNATFSCNDGVLTLNSQSCAPSAAPSCPAQTLSWGSGCSASFASITSGTTSPSTPNTASGYTGNATASCTGTTWGVASGSCDAYCAGGTLSWTASGNTCSANVPANTYVNGSDVSFNSDNANTGTALFECRGTTISDWILDAGATCSAPPPAGDPCLDNGLGSGCLISGSDYGTGCVGTDIFGNGTVCCAGCSNVLCGYSDGCNGSGSMESGLGGPVYCPVGHCASTSQVFDCGVEIRTGTAYYCN